MNIKTNAPKVNAEIHIIRAFPKAQMPDASASEDSGSRLSSRASTESSPGSSDRSQITWEIVQWGKISKTDQLLTGNPGNMPLDISVRNIEYA